MLFRSSEELASKIYGKELPLTQSRLDSYRSCPLAHFCRYTVKLSREERAEFDAPGIGTFIHAILENFFSLLAEEKRVAAELSEEELHLLHLYRKSRTLPKEMRSALIETVEQVIRLYIQSAETLAADGGKKRKTSTKGKEK